MFGTLVHYDTEGTPLVEHFVDTTDKEIATHIRDKRITIRNIKAIELDGENEKLVYFTKDSISDFVTKNL